MGAVTGKGGCFNRVDVPEIKRLVIDIELRGEWVENIVLCSHGFSELAGSISRTITYKIN